MGKLRVEVNGNDSTSVRVLHDGKALEGLKSLKLEVKVGHPNELTLVMNVSDSVIQVPPELVKLIKVEESGGAECLSRLSPQEQSIATDLSKGQTVKQIADEYAISPHTVRNHLKSIYRKLSIKSQVELVLQVRGVT